MEDDRDKLRERERESEGKRKGGKGGSFFMLMEGTKERRGKEILKI